MKKSNTKRLLTAFTMSVFLIGNTLAQAGDALPQYGICECWKNGKKVYVWPEPGHINDCKKEQSDTPGFTCYFVTTAGKKSLKKYK